MSDTAFSTIEALKKSSVSRYLQLASLFRRRVEDGQWPVGTRIPTVEELSKECGVATMTIRQALSILESEGLIERFRAKGTFVRKRPARDLWCQVQTNWTGLLIARDDAQIEILSDERNVSLPLRDNTVGRPAHAYRHLRRRHLRDGEPFLLADVYVAERIASLIPEEDYGHKTAMRLVADVEGIEITDATQVLTIDSADLVASDLLNIPLSHPVARVERCAVDSSEEIVLLAEGIYRGDKVRIDIKLK